MTEISHKGVILMDRVFNKAQVRSNGEYFGEDVQTHTNGQTTHVDPQWMVLSRHIRVTGGVMDYGYAYIEEFFDTKKDADAYAQEAMNKIKDNSYPFVWVLKCETTYIKEGVVKTVPKKKNGR